VLDGNYQVRGVEHRITKAEGFVTDVDLRSLTGAAAQAAATAPGTTPTGGAS
jgi:hypothetical protein